MHLELIGHNLCPLLQCAAIVLAEKRVPFAKALVQDSMPPQSFQARCLLGRLPLLRVEGEFLVESSAILEYIDDVAVPALHPTGSLMRARHRAWVEFGFGVVDDIRSFHDAQDAVTMLAAIAVLHDKFERIESELGDGPYPCGRRFSIVDAAFGPVFRYWNVFDRIGDFGVFERLPKVRSWRRAIAERNSVKAALDGHFEEEMWRFLSRRQSYLAGLMARTS